MKRMIMCLALMCLAVGCVSTEHDIYVGENGTRIKTYIWHGTRILKSKNTYIQKGSLMDICKIKTEHIEWAEEQEKNKEALIAERKRMKQIEKEFNKCK